LLLEPFEVRHCALNRPPAMADEEALEYTLFAKRDCKVYQIPPAASADGHKAGDWKEAIWQGACRVVGKGKDLTIKLMNGNSGELFAQCAIPNGEHEKYCERVMDSSRYWVLKVVNGQRHAFIGFGFSDRNDAFDFNCCLADFRKTFVERDAEPDDSQQIQQTMQDLSLKEGAKIKLNLKGKTQAVDEEGAEPKVKKVASGGYGGSAVGLLPPPPGGKPIGLLAPPPPPPGPAKQPTAPVANDFVADFADFDSFQSASMPPPPTAA